MTSFRDRRYVDFSPSPSSASTEDSRTHGPSLSLPRSLGLGPSRTLLVPLSVSPLLHPPVFSSLSYPLLFRPPLFLLSSFVSVPLSVTLSLSLSVCLSLSLSLFLSRYFSRSYGPLRPSCFSSGTKSTGEREPVVNLP